MTKSQPENAERNDAVQGILAVETTRKYARPLTQTRTRNLVNRLQLEATVLHTHPGRSRKKSQRYKWGGVET